MDAVLPATYVDRVTSSKAENLIERTLEHTGGRGHRGSQSSATKDRPRAADVGHGLVARSDPAPRVRNPPTVRRAERQQARHETTPKIYTSHDHSHSSRRRPRKYDSDAKDCLTIRGRRKKSTPRQQKWRDRSTIRSRPQASATPGCCCY